MTLAELVSRLGLRNFTPSLDGLLRTSVIRATASDLPSDVLAGAPGGALLVTAHSTVNMVAIAARTGLPAVLLTSGRQPDETVAARACEERILLLGTEETSFDVAGQLYALGLRGGTR